MHYTEFLFLINFPIIPFSKEALGYIDPGSGSMFLQTILALLAGGFFVFKKYVINLFGKVFKFPRKAGDNKDGSAE